MPKADESKNDPIDPAAAAQAFRAALVRFVRSKVNDQHEAEDIVQEVLLRLHRSAGQLRAQQQLGPWLFQVARNVIIDHYRARGRKPESISLEDEATDADLAAEEPSVGFTPRDATRCLTGFVEALPPPMADALRKVDLEGLTHSEVALQSGLSVPGVKSRVQRARSAVRDAVVRCCELDFSHPQGLVEYLPAQAPACPPACASNCASDACGSSGGAQPAAKPLPGTDQ
jgi:RNA polymerase sigma-70 factor (ECF subfamily)